MRDIYIVCCVLSSFSLTNLKNTTPFSLFMLQFIKRFFQKEEVDVVLPKQVVPFQELDLWIEKHTSKNAKSVAEQTKPILEKLDDAIFGAQENLKKLGNAELKNKNITARELTIMKGNRESYIHRTTQFLNQLAALYDKEAITYTDMKHFHVVYEKDVVVLSKSLLKPYAVLQHFFANESYAVAQQIKKVDEFMKELKLMLDKESTEAISDCKEQIVKIEDFIVRKRKLEEKKNKYEEDLTRVTAQEEQASVKLAKVVASEGYVRHNKLLEEQKQHEKDVAAHSAVLSHSFSVLEKALKKYGKNNPSRQLLVDAYLDNSMTALHQDSQFGIVSLLEDIKKSIATLDLKEGKKQKTLAQIEVLLADKYFSSFLQKDKELFEKKHQLAKNIKNHFATQQHKEATYMYATYKEKADVLRAELETVSKDLTGIDVVQMVKKLEVDLHQCTKFEVEIII
jgi:hypothetical protein